MERLQANLAFTCKHEEKPALLSETQQLYNCNGLTFSNAGECSI